MWIDMVNVQAMEHRRQGKEHAGETFLAESLMMFLLYWQLPHLAETVLKTDQFHDNATLFRRSYVTFLDSAQMSQLLMHLRLF
jgi:hypothetical protein